MTLQDWLDTLGPAMVEAGQAIMDVYAGAIEVSSKADASPVTKADLAAEAILLAALRRLTPDLPIIAEEEVAAGRIPAAAKTFWLVDPLDGTKEFIARNGEFTVNIGLIEDGAPILGLVLAPALGKLYRGAKGLGATLSEVDLTSGLARATHAITARPAPPTGLVALASRSHSDPKTEEILARYPIASFAAAGSSLKFCLIAQGVADFYPRTGPTMEWDVAAGDAILRAAGGTMTTLTGQPFTYGKPGYANPGFIARGRP